MVESKTLSVRAQMANRPDNLAGGTTRGRGILPLDEIAPLQIIKAARAILGCPSWRLAVLFVSNVRIWLARWRHHELINAEAKRYVA